MFIKSLPADDAITPYSRHIFPFVPVNVHKMLIRKASRALGPARGYGKRQKSHARKGMRENRPSVRRRFRGMKPAQDKPHEPEKQPEGQAREPQFSAQDAEGKELSKDRRQHGTTVAGPKKESGKDQPEHPE